MLATTISSSEGTTADSVATKKGKEKEKRKERKEKENMPHHQIKHMQMPDAKCNLSHCK